MTLGEILYMLWPAIIGGAVLAGIRLMTGPDKP